MQEHTPHIRARAHTHTPTHTAQQVFNPSRAYEGGNWREKLTFGHPDDFIMAFAGRISPEKVSFPNPGPDPDSHTHIYTRAFLWLFVPSVWARLQHNHNPNPT